MFSTEDHLYMSQALRLAEQGLYSTDPNPRVGCLLVNDGKVVGEGWHQWAGEAHAEVHALSQAGDLAKGATAYVTLEPCCHQGKTAPCSDALIAAGIARVVVAMEDPNSLVSGQGIAQLQAAGIQVEQGLMQSQAEKLNLGFIKRMQTGLPYVRCKLAMSLDGRTALESGESKWITAVPARTDVHRLRASSSAVMTGISTVLKDDAQLNVRLGLADNEVQQPIRVVLDNHLSMPVDAKMLTLPGRTIIFTQEENLPQASELQARGAEVVAMPGNSDALSLSAILKWLADEGVNELLLESGATLSGAMVSEGLVDELIIYLAPHLMGNQAKGLFNLPDIKYMQQRIELKIEDIRAVGDDWRITAKPVMVSE